LRVTCFVPASTGAAGKATAHVGSVAPALATWLDEQMEGEGLLRVRAGYHLQLEAAGRPELRDIHLA
jgi:hypothetical protein